MMAGYGTLKVVLIPMVVAMAPAHMFGIMHRPSHIYFRRWKEVYGIPNSARARITADTRIFDQIYLFNQPATTSMLPLTGSSGVL